MSKLEKQINALEKRLQKAEDELALRNLIVRYGLAVDCGDVKAALACHIEDAVYIVSSPTTGRDDFERGDLHLKGHEAIANMLESDMHQSLIPNCAHTVGPLVVNLDAENVNKAEATGYSRLYHRIGDTFSLMRLAINEWQFKRTNKGWLICQRESRMIGENESQLLLKNLTC